MAFWTGSPHPTSGLAGYPARDFGAPGGTPVFAWDTLRVERISGAPGYRGGGFGGFNVYLRDRAGGRYFMTHVENVRAKIGDTLRPGQQVAAVGNYGSPHVHLGYTGGDPVSTLSLKPEYLFTPGGAVAGANVVESSARRSAPKGKSGSTFWPVPDVPYLPQFPQDVPGFDRIGPALGVGVPSITNPLKAFDTIGDVFSWLGANWDRVLEVAGGFVLIVIGLLLMGRSLGVTKTKIEVVERNLPGGQRRELERRAASAEEREYVRHAGAAGRRRAGVEPRRPIVPAPGDEPRTRRRSGYDPATAEVPY